MGKKQIALGLMQDHETPLTARGTHCLNDSLFSVLIICGNRHANNTLGVSEKMHKLTC